MPVHAEHRRRVGAVLATALAAASLAAAPAASAASTSAVYDATPTPLPPNVASLGFQATSTAQVGDRVRLGAGGRVLDSVTLTMSTWAPHSAYTSDARYAADGTTWSHPVTVNVYAPDLGPDGAPTTLLASTTAEVRVPWRPEADPTCPTSTAWRAADGDCYNGLAFDATVDFGGSGVVLPDEVVVGVAFDTQSYGADPIGTPGPYNSLNVGIPDDQAASAGSDADPDEVFWDSRYAGRAPGLRPDNGWTPNGTVALAVTATDPLVCSFTTDGSTMRLDGDCETSTTVVVPDGVTLDGAGHTITAVDPEGGHFTGAVVAAGGATGNVRDLVVSARSLANVCDAGDDRLTGILFDGAAGSITGTTVDSVRQGTSGCQEGNGIVVRNAAAGARPEVTVDGNTVTAYQKNGITVTGNVAATVTNNTVTGDGPVSTIAQNGVQVSYGATALLRDNRVSGNDYTPAEVTACGVLLYEASGVKASRNVLDANEKDMCNYGKGGGKYAPES